MHGRRHLRQASAHRRQIATQSAAACVSRVGYHAARGHDIGDRGAEKRRSTRICPHRPVLQRRDLPL